MIDDSIGGDSGLQPTSTTAMGFMPLTNKTARMNYGIANEIVQRGGTAGSTSKPKHNAQTFMAARTSLGTAGAPGRGDP